MAYKISEDTCKYIIIILSGQKKAGRFERKRCVRDEPRGLCFVR